MAGIIESILGMIRGITEIAEGFAAVGLISAIIVIIGAILIYMPGKELIGGFPVRIFSILSIFIGGGFFIGLILGIVGGILGKVTTTKPPFLLIIDNNCCLRRDSISFLNHTKVLPCGSIVDP